jgi:hypothetical protein
MTNGEKIKALFPNICITYDEDMVVIDGFPTSVVSNIEFDKAWWNAEYKEPITQERQAESDKFDAAFQDGYDHGYAQARFDYEQEPTTKNDLGIDCIKKSDAIDIIQDMHGLARADVISDAVNRIIAMPSITPQKPRKGHWGWLRCDMYVCSECKNVYTDLSGIKDGLNYCPNCGSRNEVEE